MEAENHSRRFRRSSKDTSFRVFGKDLTNIERPNRNKSLLKKEQVRKQLGREKSKSFFNRKADIKEKLIERKDAIDQYPAEIINHIVSLEHLQKADLKGQISDKMRAILIDWLIDVHVSFQLKQQTLFLALEYLNFYCSKVQVSKNQYQLVGITCLWIASKYEEIYPPRMKNYVQVTADTYSLKELKNMEGLIIQVLEFNLIRTTCYQLLQVMLKNEGNSNIGQMSSYILELSLMNGLAKQFKPTILALSALTLGEAVYKSNKNMTKEYKNLFKSPKTQTLICFREMTKLIEGTNICSKYGLSALQRKYESKKRWEVSKLKIKANN